MSSAARFCLLFSLLLIRANANADYRSPTVTSAPIHVSESGYQHQQQQQPPVLTQSYKVLPEPHNYYPYPQYLPTNAGYSNIQTVGRPFQIYGASAPGAESGSSYGLAAPAPAPIPHRFVATSTPTPPTPLLEHQHGSAPAHYHHGQGHQAVAHKQAAPVPFMIASKPVLSYGAANPFLANLPPAQGVYGAPVPVDSSHRGYDGSELSSASPAAPPAFSSSVDDTWEALEASLDADPSARRRLFGKVF
ncbi:unnamed protein product [Caenorhabditis sp. 36 PRJEB53466]|nr:unnamed protein product [Caenorhabditis sp. 36 PRJEB53466]